jgi:hypothetical protein
MYTLTIKEVQLHNEVIEAFPLVKKCLLYSIIMKWLR